MNLLLLLTLFLGSQAVYITGDVTFSRSESNYTYSDQVYVSPTYYTTLTQSHREEYWRIDCTVIDHSLLDSKDGLKVHVLNSPGYMFRASVRKGDDNFAAGNEDNEIWDSDDWWDDDSVRVCDVASDVYYLEIKWESASSYSSTFEDDCSWYVEIERTGDDWDCGGSEAFAGLIIFLIVISICCCVCIVGGLVAAGCCVVGTAGAGLFACCACCMSEKKRRDQKKENEQKKQEQQQQQQQQTQMTHQQQYVAPAPVSPYGGPQQPPNPYGGQQQPPNPYGAQQPNPYGQQPPTTQPNYGQQPPQPNYGQPPPVQNQNYGAPPPNHYGGAPAPNSGYPAAPTYGNEGTGTGQHE